MLKIEHNWGKIANYPPQCSTKICTPGSRKMPFLEIPELKNPGNRKCRLENVGPEKCRYWKMPVIKMPE